MGTFIIRPTLILSGGTPIQALPLPVGVGTWIVNTFPAVSLLEALTDPTFPDFNRAYAEHSGIGPDITFADTVRFELSTVTPCIFLDGSPVAVNLAGLPTGFQVTSASVECLGGNLTGSSSTNPGDTYLQQGAGVELINDPNSVVGQSFPYASVPTMLALMTAGIGLRVDLSAEGGGFTTVSFFIVRVEGVYGIEISEFDLIPTGPVNVGDPIVIKPKKGEGGDEITDVFVGDKRAPIEDRDDGRVIFRVPNTGGPTQDQPVTIRRRGPDSDPQPVGTLEVLYAESSGIYEFISNKTNDTLYTTSGSDVTEDVAIPDVFAAFGFIDG